MVYQQNTIRDVFIISLFLIHSAFMCRAQDQYNVEQSEVNYPFSLPDTVVAEFDVQFQEAEAANNLLLGYNIFGYTSSRQIEFMRSMDPVTVRFPHGVWANFYNWETDGFDTYGDTWDHGSHDDVLEVYMQKNIKVGIPGLQALNEEKKLKNEGQGYDMMWTYNLNYDDNAKSVARTKDLLAKGLEVKDIEMGNEHFWKTQRSTRTATPEQYVALARSLSDTLKQVFPGLRVSIPLSWRTGHADYNTILADDNQYFDAISVHKYTGADPDVPGESDAAYSSILTGRLSMARDVNFARSFAPGKPVWLTEWGVSAGDDFRGAAGLGMADCYLYMFENQHIYERANWFSVNGLLNSFITISSNRVIKYPFEKTGYGSVYGILRSVFENSTLLKGIMYTEQLSTAAGSTNAVNARAVIKDGDTLVFAVNLADKPVRFDLSIYGNAYDQGFRHEAMVFDALDVEPVLPINADPLSLVKEGKGDIFLPPLSVNTITLKGGVDYYDNTISFISPDEGAVIDRGTNLEVEARAGVDVTGVSLYINDELVRNIYGGPYRWGLDTLVDTSLKNLAIGFCKLKLLAFSLGGERADSITIEVQEAKVQEPFGDAISIPGRFEAEDYDSGGEGLAYHDSDDVNKKGVYREDGVDIIESGTAYAIGYTNKGEWLEYTLDVTEAGHYDIVVSYASGLAGGGAKIGVSFPDEQAVLVDSFELPRTVDWNSYEDITLASQIEITGGEHILRLGVVEKGFYLDWIEMKKSEVSFTPAYDNPGVVVFPNPSLTGIFELGQRTAWEVYSILGQKMASGEGRQVDISKLSRGLFILRTTDSVHKILFE